MISGFSALFFFSGEVFRKTTAYSISNIPFSNPQKSIFIPQKIIYEIDMKGRVSGGEEREDFGKKELE